MKRAAPPMVVPCVLTIECGVLAPQIWIYSPALDLMETYREEQERNHLIYCGLIVPRQSHPVETLLTYLVDRRNSFSVLDSKSQAMPSQSLLLWIQSRTLLFSLPCKMGRLIGWLEWLCFLCVFLANCWWIDVGVSMSRWVLWVIITTQNQYHKLNYVGYR